MTSTAGVSGPWDIVLFGASGFVGRLIARRLTEVAPPGLRWAIAGRSPAKLRELHGKIDKHVAADKQRQCFFEFQIQSELADKIDKYADGNRFAINQRTVAVKNDRVKIWIDHVLNS